MLVLGIFIGLWVGAPLGFVIAAMLGPREREELAQEVRCAGDRRGPPSEAA